MKRVMLISMVFAAMVLISQSCSKDSSGNEGPEGMELGSGEGTGEAHGPEGSEQGGGGESGNESGTIWNIDETADEIVNGIHLILGYDASQEAFVGTLENINTTVAPQVRVEVHIFDANGNSTEYGPTPAADMAPGEIRNVSLSVAGAGTFVTFNMHPEVGSSGSGG